MKFPPWWGYGYFLELHNDVSSPSYLKKKQSKLKNKQTKNLAFIMSTGSSIALCLGFHKPKCLLKIFFYPRQKESGFPVTSF